MEENNNDKEEIKKEFDKKVLQTQQLMEENLDSFSQRVEQSVSDVRDEIALSEKLTDEKIQELSLYVDTQDAILNERVNGTSMRV